MTDSKDSVESDTKPRDAKDDHDTGDENAAPGIDGDSNTQGEPASPEADSEQNSETVDPADNQAGAEPDTDSTADSKSSKHDEEEEGSLWPWAVGIVLVLLVELFIYGHDGYIKVCVGKEGVTDFSLTTTGNLRKRPYCAERINLGMWSHGEQHAEEALKQACTMAARFSGGKGLSACMRNDGKWTRRVTKEQIMPWDSRLYRRLLWLD